MLIASACSSPPASPKRSQQFIEDSTLLAKYEPWFDSLYAVVPAYSELKKVKCPAGCFDDLKLFEEEHPFMIFEPGELSRTQNRLSYFRYEKVQGFHEEAERFI